MGQAKARGTKEQRVQEALSAPPKQRKMSNREMRDEINHAVNEYMGRMFRGLVNNR